MLRRRATRGLGSWFSGREREGPPAKWTLLQEGGGRKSINKRFGARRHLRPIDRPLQYSSGRLGSTQLCGRVLLTSRAYAPTSSTSSTGGAGEVPMHRTPSI